jgi:signal transduction histidine kinase
LITLEARHAEALRETSTACARWHGAVRGPEWLVLAADADRQRIARELHESVQQYLVAPNGKEVREQCGRG